MIDTDVAGSALLATTINRLGGDAEYYLAWWVDILDADSSPNGYTLLTNYRAGSYTHLWAGDITGSTYSDYVDQSAHLERIPTYEIKSGREVTKAKFRVAVAGGSGDSIASALLTARANKYFEGGKAAFGMYIGSPYQKVMFLEGRPQVTDWGEEWFEMQIINSSEYLKLQMPNEHLTIDWFQRVEDGKNNPDPSNPWEQLNAQLQHPTGPPAGTGRYRKGQKINTGFDGGIGGLGTGPHDMTSYFDIPPGG